MVVIVVISDTAVGTLDGYRWRATVCVWGGADQRILGRNNE